MLPSFFLCGYAALFLQVPGFSDLCKNKTAQSKLTMNSINLTPQQIFNAVIFDDAPVIVSGISKAEYNSLRVAMLRRFSTFKQSALNFDAAGYEERYIQCSYDSIAEQGTFALKLKEEALRKSYAVMLATDSASENLKNL
jgi:hypothetical protein